MKFFKLMIFILVIFSKTGNVLSENRLFDVNNIKIVNTPSKNINNLTSQAMKKGFSVLIERILLKEDKKRLDDLNLSDIEELVAYYQTFDEVDDLNKSIKVFNIFFDKDKIHNLFYKRNILYSNLIKSEFYLLPIFKKDEELNIYAKNFFYDRWNKISFESEIVDFILPIENIEIIQKLNKSKGNLEDLNLVNLFNEYSNKNLGIVLITENNSKIKKVFLKTNILGKKINKSLEIKNYKLEKSELHDKIIIDIKNELVNIVKSQNLIDIRTPSFLNAKFKINKKNSLVELKKRVEQIDLVEKIFIQEFNNEFVILKIKFLGKVNNIINELKKEKINLRLNGEQWSLNII
tara:strand:- start:1348 stop:2394 length:1047 start_codon:yes stop_codon:yes gene_type:complete